MDKLAFVNLWDAYSGLLTPVQREITDLYFNLDLTVSEIAAEKGISRQAVSDCLQQCKKQLEEYECELRFLKKREGEREAVINWVNKFTSAHPEYAKETEELFRIFDKEI